MRMPLQCRLYNALRRSNQLRQNSSSHVCGAAAQDGIDFKDGQSEMGPLAAKRYGLLLLMDKILHDP